MQRTQYILGNSSATWPVEPGGNWLKLPAEQRATVGDWMVLDGDGEKITRVLDRKSVFKRLAAGTKIDVQLMAANIDTLFVVSSCNEDFNESRLERYLALDREAGVDPIIILTKADLAQDAEGYRQRAQVISGGAPIEVVNALAHHPWRMRRRGYPKALRSLWRVRQLWGSQRWSIHWQGRRLPIRLQSVNRMPGVDTPRRIASCMYYSPVDCYSREDAARSGRRGTSNYACVRESRFSRDGLCHRDQSHRPCHVIADRVKP